MTTRSFDQSQAAPALACATGIERTMRDDAMLSLSMMRFVVATRSLA
jgi:hypothetical protein